MADTNECISGWQTGSSAETTYIRTRERTKETAAAAGVVGLEQVGERDCDRQMKSEIDDMRQLKTNIDVSNMISKRYIHHIYYVFGPKRQHGSIRTE